MDSIRKNCGFVVGNSSLAADVSSDGTMFGRITYNPPCFNLGENERYSAGCSHFIFECGGKSYNDYELGWEIDEKLYPVYRAHAFIGKIEIRVISFAPISAGNIERTFIPAIISRIEAVNGGEREDAVTVTLAWEVSPALAEGSVISEGEGENAAFFSLGKLFSGSCGFESCASAYTDGVFSMSGTLAVGAKKRADCCIWFGIFERENSRARFLARDSAALCGYIAENHDALYGELCDFISCIPNTGDEEIYRYTRWYTQAAVLLTKSTEKNKTITMGYTELNQRDSFWTSFLHLTLWPELEKEIIRTSICGMRADGKVPTCILPLIDREYDIDINEYFCLRIARYYKLHRDKAFLAECFDCYIKAVSWLISRDLDGDGIPEQAPPENDMAFWCDWKDVRFVMGRRLAPHFALLWLAVLRDGAFLASELGKADISAEYEHMYNSASRKINADFNCGGMWNGSCYTELWYDGRKSDNVLIDQTVGIAFSVVPQDRVEKIYQTLTKNENAFGIPETYPYRSAEEYPGADAPGIYHNGGIWPFLTFCDALGRYKSAHGEDAERLIRKIGYYDLEAAGDHSPNEYLNGETGKNCGKEVQGWSSALFGTVMLGAFEPSYNGEKLTIKLNFPKRDFSTKYPLPYSDEYIIIARRDGELSCSDKSGRVEIIG